MWYNYKLDICAWCGMDMFRFRLVVGVCILHECERQGWETDISPHLCSDHVFVCVCVALCEHVGLFRTVQLPCTSQQKMVTRRLWSYFLGMGPK